MWARGLLGLILPTVCQQSVCLSQNVEQWLLGNPAGGWTENLGEWLLHNSQVTPLLLEQEGSTPHDTFT